MSGELLDKVNHSVESLLSDCLWADSFELYETRDFWNNYDENDFISAYNEAAQYYREAITYISENLVFNGTIVKRGDDTFPIWLPVNEACLWYLEYRKFVLYWEHMDKELPVIVHLYAFDPKQPSHRLLDNYNGIWDHF